MDRRSDLIGRVEILVIKVVDVEFDRDELQAIPVRDDNADGHACIFNYFLLHSNSRLPSVQAFLRVG
jgi:hypothetical protein